ncbi:hypothetical protein [Bacillus cereus]|uniref:Uncharacterized protein n=1 Tax=Bacillus cereus TaxID=1396 RepID=A0A2A8ZS51_BACCE|nr:hypothetical protein [Bacillus cereus]PFE08354.1 hypothetical protein CN307_28770 [Bacillus cereus]
MARDHFTSLGLETAARKVLGLDSRGHIGGIIDADSIDAGDAYMVLAMSLTPYYIQGNQETKNLINNFLEKYYALREVNEEYNQLVQEASSELVILVEKIRKL